MPSSSLNIRPFTHTTASLNTGEMARIGLKISPPATAQLLPETRGLEVTRQRESLRRPPQRR